MAPGIQAKFAAMSERQALEERYGPLLVEDLHLGRHVSYAGNKRVPFLRLYRYKEAFSLSLVNHILDRFEARDSDLIFDPFAGMGTTLFASMLRGLPSVGIDRLPIAAFSARTLPLFFNIDHGRLLDTYEGLLPTIDDRAEAPIADDVRLLRLAFDGQVLSRLRRWKSAIDALPSPLHDIFLLLFFSILEMVSYISNDGQFPRLKPHKRLLHPDEALALKVHEAEADMATWPLFFPGASRPGLHPLVVDGDARSFNPLPNGMKPTIVVTSPPYANRYDYTRSYCLELCFHFVRNFSELRDLRLSILRSHIESKTHDGDAPVHPAIDEVVSILSRRRLNNPRILSMLVAYFVDMDRVIQQWSGMLAESARVAVVVDNVRFEGEIIPVDLILSEIAQARGFTVDEVRVARYKGNSSQQMGRFGREVVRESILFWSKRR